MSRSYQISKEVRSIGEAVSIYFNQLVYDKKRRGQDIVTLSLGEAFFKIPAFDFGAIPWEKGYHYSDSRGIPELREKLAQLYKTQYSATVDPAGQIMITAGSKAAIFMAMRAVLEPGDKVLMHEPAWLSYETQAMLIDAVPGFIPHDVPVKDFARHFDDRTRLLVINNPNNPAGRIYSHEEMRQLYEACREHGIWLMVDEAYGDFCDADKFGSMTSIVPGLEGVIVVNSLSKNMGMSGWRIGYAISSPDFIDQLLKLNQHLITCAPTLLQYYLAHYFDDILSLTLPQAQAALTKRRRVAEEIRKVGLDCLNGDSTFYFFVSIGSFPGTSFDLAVHLLLEKGIAVVPGSAYGKGTDRFIRVSIGTESEERIAGALREIKAAIRQPVDRQRLIRQLQDSGLREMSEMVSVA